MRIDINAFFGHWPYHPLPHTSGEDLLRLMDRFGIDRAAVASLRGLHGDWRTANAETLALARAHPDRFTPIACMSPMNGGGAGPLRKLAAEGFRGIRLYPLLIQGYSLRSPFTHEIAAAAGELSMLVIVPTRPMMNFRFPTLPIAEIGTLARQHPTTRILLSGPNYLSEFRAATETMADCPNLSIEFACMQGYGAVRNLVEAVGEQRVLFGTGTVLHYPACNVAKLDHAGLSPAQHEAVAWQNATRLLGLGVG